MPYELSMKPDVASEVSEYCEKHSNALPPTLNEHWLWTSGKFKDADKMSSQLQV